MESFFDRRELLEAMLVCGETSEFFLKVYPSLDSKSEFYFQFWQKPWLYKGDFLLGRGGLLASSKDFYFLEFRVKTTDRRLSIRVLSEGKIYKEIFLDKETPPGDISQKTLSELIELAFGFGSGGT